MQHPTIIVESSVANRRQIVEHLRNAGTTEIIEAISCNHGLELLADLPRLDTCLPLGPRLRLNTATKFLNSSQRIVERRNTPCAFYVVLSPDAPEEDRKALREAGASNLLIGGLSDHRFTDLVRRAVAREFPLPELRSETPRTIQDLRPFFPETDLVPGFHRYREAHMDEVLVQLATRLQTLAGDIDRGHFHVRKNGTPSLATSDAIRVTLEAAFAEQSQVFQIGTPGHHFITSVVRWFEARPHLTPEGANEMLREALLATAARH